jgi:hypothetical protein
MGQRLLIRATLAVDLKMAKPASLLPVQKVEHGSCHLVLRLLVEVSEHSTSNLLCANFKTFLLERPRSSLTEIWSSCYRGVCLQKADVWHRTVVRPSAPAGVGVETGAG